MHILPAAPVTATRELLLGLPHIQHRVEEGEELLRAAADPPGPGQSDGRRGPWSQSRVTQVTHPQVWPSLSGRQGVKKTQRFGILKHSSSALSSEHQW